MALDETIRKKLRDAGALMAEEQILLVGSNPLPPAVAALAMRPKSVHLVYTPQVKEPMDRLVRLLSDQEILLDQRVCLNGGGSDLVALRRDLEAKLTQDLCGQAGLHYSSGTKAMCVAAHEVWRERGGCQKQASYLDAHAMLRFQAGPAVSLRDAPKLTLNHLFDLHRHEGLTHADHHKDSKALEDATKVYESRGMRSSPGKWLEIWLANKLEHAEGDQDEPLFDEVHQSVVGGRQDFEADVVAVRGYRAFLFSCTTQSKKSDVKHKLFEAHQRAQQIGGEHARFATVSFSDSPTMVMKEMQRGWEGYDDSRCFGVEDIFSKAGGDALIDEVRRWVLEEGGAS